MARPSSPSVMLTALETKMHEKEDKGAVEDRSQIQQSVFVKGDVELGRHGGFKGSVGANAKPGEPDSKKPLRNEFVTLGNPQIATASLDLGDSHRKNQAGQTRAFPPGSK